jgi:hypothetical protein
VQNEFPKALPGDMEIACSIPMPKGMKFDKLAAKSGSFIEGLNIPILPVMREESYGKTVERHRPLSLESRWIMSTGRLACVK